MGMTRLRLDLIGLRLIETGWDMQALADDPSTPPPIRRALTRLAVTVIDTGVDVEDVTGDVAVACQILRNGRDRAPNAPLRLRLAELAALRHKNTPEGLQPAGALEPEPTELLEGFGSCSL